MKSSLQNFYKEVVVPKLQKDLGIKNIMEIPKIEKVTINVGAGSYITQNGKSALNKIIENVTLISGQKPIVRNSRMSVSNFKLREGMPVGVYTTLRSEKAYNFLGKVIDIVFPRVLGFSGVKKNIFDKTGNMSFGFKDYTVFPEGAVDDSGRPHGIQITITIKSKEVAHSKALIEAFNFPFRKN
jgi:large subunit ribosomal protein L5